MKFEVDRDEQLVDDESPSSRRAWIEIENLSIQTYLPKVALLAEGVD